MSQKRYVLCAFFFAFVLYGAEARPGFALRGEISRGSTTDLDRLLVELVTGGRVVERTAVSTDGSFTVRDVPEGQYELRVTTLHGQMIHQQFVHISGFTGPLCIRLPEPAARPGGAISLSQLSRRVPKKARQELASSESALRKGNIEEATKRLENAVRIAPDYMEAHNNLGVRRLSAGDVDGAIEEFQRARELDPSAARVHVNLALALATAGRLPDAAISARRGLQLEPSNASARYVLGVADLAAGRCSSETERDLRSASDLYPRARLSLAKLLECRGAKSEAATELRTYLDSPRAGGDRPGVEQWIRRLTGK